jgi:Ca2+-transporting ATPase
LAISEQVVEPTTLRWYAQPIGTVEAELGTDVARGLAAADAAARLARRGPNELARPKAEPWWEEVVESLTEPLVLLLLAVAVLYFLLGSFGDALTILAVILLVSAIEVANESRAKRAIASLRALTAPVVPLVRDGQPRDVPARDLVPGDLLLLRSGERIPADVRLVEAVGLRVDESSLTGESIPVDKQADVVLPAETALGDRRNLAFTGTLVTAGHGRGLVVATGRDTELGRIAKLTETTREPRTPLQQQLRQLAGWLLWLALGFSVLIPLLAIVVAKRSSQEALLTGLTLAFATIPEELPILVTIVLGLGAYHLAKRHAIVKRLRAAETLGSVSAVGTDKTGTLTENRLRLTELVTADGNYAVPLPSDVPTVRRALEVAVLASEAQLVVVDGRRTAVGDPTEIALFDTSEQAGVAVAAVRAAVPILAVFPFDHVRQRMAVLYANETRRILALKGAPEVVLALCSALRVDGGRSPLGEDRRRALLAAAERMAARGLRVLAVAERELTPDDRADASAEVTLTFLGLLGLEDPPRPEVPDAVAALQRAGVRVLMLTGDHPATARAIAERVGIDAKRVVVGRELEASTDDDLRDVLETTSVFARISPEHKLRIVRALASDGRVVAVTGDGINDAPALREAAIGIAMGRTGTDVARETADLVLADDNFATVTVAVRDGRALFANLRKAVRYYLAAKVALIGVSLVAVLAGLATPFVPVQIIVMELFMDLGASTTFVAEPPEEDVMARPPRPPHHPFMDRAMQVGIFGGGVSLAVAVLVAFFWTLAHGADLAAAQTAAFAAWLVGHLVLAAHMRTEREPLARVGLLGNRNFLIWTIAVLALLAIGITVPFVGERLHVARLPSTSWGIVVAAAIIFPSWWELAKWLTWRQPR